MTRIDDDEEWAEQHDLDECDYLDGYITYMEGGSDHCSMTRAWREGWEAAKASKEFQRSQASPGADHGPHGTTGSQHPDRSVSFRQMLLSPHHALACLP
jgi:hypothetical protein